MTVFVSVTVSSLFLILLVSAGIPLHIFSNGDIDSPVAIVFDVNGDLLVSSYRGNNVIRLDPSTGFQLYSYPPVGSFVYGLAVDSYGNIYTSVYAHNAIVKTASNGTRLGLFTFGVSNPLGLTVSKDDELYFINFELTGGTAGMQQFYTVAKMTNSGLPLMRYEPFGPTSYVAVDDVGNIYTTTTNSVKKLNRQGKIVMTMTPPHDISGEALGIALDKFDNVFVCYDMNKNVVQFYPNGTIAYLYNISVVSL